MSPTIASAYPAAGVDGGKPLKVHTSVAPDLDPDTLPEARRAEVFPPTAEEQKSSEGAAKSATSVQDVPFQDSVLDVSGGVPPKTKTDVLVSPVPPKPFRPVFKSVDSVQLVPFHNSLTVKVAPGGLLLWPPA